MLRAPSPQGAQAADVPSRRREAFASACARGELRESDRREPRHDSATESIVPLTFVGMSPPDAARAVESASQHASL